MIEVVVFGKGYGESILLHIGEKWFVVDSFIESKSRKPIAIKYLSDNGYSIDDISGIICSHWDNDHVLGISQIIEQHSRCLPVCLPIAYDDRRFTEYVTFNATNQSGSTTEFYKVLKLIAKRKASYFFAISERNLFQKEINDTTISLRALSPNDNQFAAFLDAISIPKEGQTKRHIPLEENKISVVTYIKTCLDSILLGGDMENSSNGWESICDSFVDNKSHVFKIPHHGSENGYCSKVWQKMVEKPISIITRFNPSNLPTDEMLDNIAKDSSAVYVVGSKARKDREILGKVKKHGDINTVVSISLLDSKYGYVKLSKYSEDEDWQVDIYGAVEKYK